MMCIYSIFMILLLGCNEPNQGDSVQLNSDSLKIKVDEKNIQIQDKRFEAFVNRFENRDLPISNLTKDDFDIFNIDGLTLKERYEKKIIPLEEVIKYFCSGDSKLNNQPSGGIYEYYFGYKLISNGDFITLFYFRPSDDTYYYRVVTFDYNGKLIDDLGIGGQKLEEAYMWFVINKDLSIHTEEILCDMMNFSEENGVQALRTDRDYQIKSNGKIELIKKTELGQVTYIQDTTVKSSFRLKMKD